MPGNLLSEIPAPTIEAGGLLHSETLYPRGKKKKQKQTRGNGREERRGCERRRGKGESGAIIPGSLLGYLATSECRQVLGGVYHPGFSWGSTAGGSAEGLLSTLPLHNSRLYGLRILPPVLLQVTMSLSLSSPASCSP